MRLLKRDEKGCLSLTDDLPDQEIPEYVALSHTWGAAAQEVTFQDFEKLSARKRARKRGYKKIQFCSDQAARDGFQYFWIDTCCINKTNNVELTEAINSMFRRYRQAARCYVHSRPPPCVSIESPYRSPSRSPRSPMLTQPLIVQPAFVPDTERCKQQSNISKRSRFHFPR